MTSDMDGPEEAEGLNVVLRTTLVMRIVVPSGL